MKSYVTRFGVFLVTVALVAGMAACTGGDGGPNGDDDDNNPPPSENLEIRTWYDLNAVRDNLGGNHVVMNDLDSTTPGYQELASPTANTGKGWEPLGFFSIVLAPDGSVADAKRCGLTGAFDGQGYEIHDPFINRPDESEVGLFGFVDEGGVIKNVGVVNATLTGEKLVGGLLGDNFGSVSNSYYVGDVSGGDIADDAAVGGLIGINYGTVRNCYSSGNVTGYECVGGLVGWNYDTVNNSYSTGSVIGERRIGGLVGYQHTGTVSNSYSTGGAVVGHSDVGGLVGSNEYSSISNSYYNYDQVLINGENIITFGALFNQDFNQWLDNGKSLDVNDKLSQENGYYVVNNVIDFKQLLAFGQNGSLKFRLKNDLNLATEPNFYIPYLVAEFDGNGHRISHLSLNFDLVSPLGLFGYLAPGAKVTHVGVENVNITGYVNVGSLVGSSYEGTVSDSYCVGSVTGNSSVGGLVGSNWGTVDRSHFAGSVTGDVAVGGLVGWNYLHTVSDSHSTGSVTGGDAVGGLVGVNYGIVTRCYSAGRATGEDGVGGLVGVGYTVQEGYPIIYGSFWDTETSGQPTSAGGTGKTSAQMKSIATFSGVDWDIVGVALNQTNLAYTWNIVDGETYPFLSWQS